MAKQDYILKKYVSANNAAEALKQDRATKVSEVFLVGDAPKKIELVPAIGFQTIYPED